MGDCHSQHYKVQEALSWLESEYPDYHLICLGDIFDSRLDNLEKNYPPYSDPTVVYQIFKQLVDQGHILLQSNHQDKLKRWLRWDLEGKKPNSVEPKQGLQYTLSQFVNNLTVEEKANLYQWLFDLPHHVVIDSYDFQHDQTMTFLCGHGYFNTAVNIEQPSEKHKDQALYGILTKDKKRVAFWEDDSPLSFYGRPAIRVVGHHHQLWKGLYNRVIDGGCGSTGGSLCVHIPAYNLWQEF